MLEVFLWIKSHTSQLANIAGILGFFMVLGTWIHTWVYQRKKIRISIIQYTKIERYHIFLLSIENLSRLPVSISSINVITQDEAIINCHLTPVKVWEVTSRKGQEITNHEIRKSIQFPISIFSLGGLSDYVVFEDYQGIFPIAPIDVTFQACTNRGRALKMKLSLEIPDPPEEMF